MDAAKVSRHVPPMNVDIAGNHRFSPAMRWSIGCAVVRVGGFGWQRDLCPKLGRQSQGKSDPWDGRIFPEYPAD